MSLDSNCFASMLSLRSQSIETLDMQCPFDERLPIYFVFVCELKAEKPDRIGAGRIVWEACKT
jgi:hypothetical protein